MKIDLLEQLAESCHHWLQQSSEVPIDNHLFLSDLRTVALVDTTGSVSWMCTPRIDGVPLFGALVGGPAAGHFRISSAGTGEQSYVGNSLIGNTTFGSISIVDFLDCSSGRAYQRAGRSDLIRQISGTGTVKCEFAPKFDFGRIPTRISGVPGGLRVDCGQQLFILHGPELPWNIRREGIHDIAECELTLQDETVSLALLMGTASPIEPQFLELQKATASFWEKWHATLRLPTTATALVSRSALTLRGLCYGPTGAIAAAATTSLPETIGGIRNWDYRFAWPRDACLAARSLLRLGAVEPAMRLLDWHLSLVMDSDTGGFISPLYTVTGREVLGEAEVAAALGYRGSRPVRIGNLASGQLQLDTLGPIAELMLALAQRRANLTGEHVQLCEKLVELVATRWNDPDSGIWEIRDAQRHYLHSKLMCWYAVHCCTEVSRYLGIERPDWNQLAAVIRRQIELEGYDENLGSYIAAYDLAHPDAALLWIVLSGFHPPEHPRSIGTVRYILESLVSDGCVYRYHFNDALQGQEGEFIICRSWLIEALSMMGRASEARLLFDEMVSRIGPLGLLSEQWGGPQRCALGNYPQAYSHLALINAACAIEPSK